MLDASERRFEQHHRPSTRSRYWRISAPHRYRKLAISYLPALSATWCRGRRAGVGKLIGTRTWGGLVGMAGGPPLMDGGFVGAPSSGIYNPITGEWEVENIGVPPDIEVEQDPALVRKGRDPQLEKAVEVAMEELKNNPPAVLRRPAFPNYNRPVAH
jgi:hypothetical protein